MKWESEGLFRFEEGGGEERDVDLVEGGWNEGEKTEKIFLFNQSFSTISENRVRRQK